MPMPPEDPDLLVDMPPEEALEHLRELHRLRDVWNRAALRHHRLKLDLRDARTEMLDAQADITAYIASIHKPMPLFDRSAAGKPVDVNEELAAGVAEVEAKRAAATISVNGSKPVDLDKFEATLKAAAALESDPDFQRGEAEGEAWHKAKPKRGRRRKPDAPEARP